MKLKLISCLGALLLCGCANQKAYYDALRNKDDNETALRIEYAKTEAARWAGLVAIAPKLDASGAAAAGVALALGKPTEALHQATRQSTPIPPPKDFWDYAEQVTRVGASLVNAAMPWALAVEARKSQEIASLAAVAQTTSRDAAAVAMNGQSTEALRDLGIASVGFAANAVKGSVTNYSVGGDFVAGGGITKVGGDFVTGGTFAKAVNSYNPISTNPNPLVVGCKVTFDANGNITNIVCP